MISLCSYGTRPIMAPPLTNLEMPGARCAGGCLIEQAWALPQSCNHGLPSDEEMLIEGSGQDHA
jgi:hypothetical protein